MHYLAVVDAEVRAKETEDELRRRSSLVASPTPVTRRPGASMHGSASVAGLAATSNVSSVVMQLLESNVILETFGNAETVRSYNSSRFGKYVEVTLSNGLVVGSTITSYLLEKTRVVQQSANERNYHSFYQLILGHGDHLAAPFAPLADTPRDVAEAAAFDFQKHLPTRETIGEFGIMCNGLREVPGVDDGAGLKELLSAMALFMPETTTRQILRLLTAILYIGKLKIIGALGKWQRPRQERDPHSARPLPEPAVDPPARALSLCL